MIGEMDSLLRTYQKIQTVLKDPKALDDLSEPDKRALLEWLENAKYNWELNSRDNQKIPAGKWTNWLLLAGRGYGKTRVGAETIRDFVVQRGYKAVGLIGPTASDARDTMIDGKGGSSLLEVSHPDERLEYFPTKRRLQWGNGAQGSAFSAEEPERLRGPQHDIMWCLSGDSMVLMSDGSESRIDEIGPGDWVRTTGGRREVLSVSSRWSELVELVLVDGRRLVGSGEHPVLTEFGWKRLGRLTKYDKVYLWKENGDKTSRDTSAATKAAGSSTGTGSSTRKPTAPFLRAATFITRMASRATTGLRTLWLSRQSRTSSTTHRRLLGGSASGAGNRLSRPGTLSIASLAGRGPMRQPENSLNGSASTVERVLCQGAEAIAVKGVSTLAQGGLVYNLEVDGEHDFIANGIVTHNCDELAAWRYLEETWDMAMFGLRLGSEPKNIITSTPKPVGLLKELARSAVPSHEMRDGMVVETVITRGSTMENSDNLAPQFLETLMKKYEGTRLGRQELYAEILDDNPNALFSQDDIDSSRVERESGSLRSGREVSFRFRLSQGAERSQKFSTTLEEIVVAVDPSMSADVTSDETGIVVMALGKDGHLYVLEDGSGVMSPNDWASRVVRLYEKYNADCVVAEVNQGGDLVENTIRTVEKDLSIGRLNYKKVRASKGKVSRAEPVAAMLEQGRIHHVDDFPKLEDQLVTFSPGYQRSPDRLDAYVWGAHHLSVQRNKKGFFIF